MPTKSSVTHGSGKQTSSPSVLDLPEYNGPCLRRQAKKEGDSLLEEAMRGLDAMLNAYGPIPQRRQPASLEEHFRRDTGRVIRNAADRNAIEDYEAIMRRARGMIEPGCLQCDYIFLIGSEVARQIEAACSRRLRHYTVELSAPYSHYGQAARTSGMLFILDIYSTDPNSMRVERLYSTISFNEATQF